MDSLSSRFAAMAEGFDSVSSRAWGAFLIALKLAMRSDISCIHFCQHTVLYTSNSKAYHITVLTLIFVLSADLPAHDLWMQTELGEYLATFREMDCTLFSET